MPKQSKWTHRLVPSSHLVPTDPATPLVARLILSHDDDLDESMARNIILDAEMAPLVARYAWRWDRSQMWAWAELPEAAMAPLQLPTNRLYLHKLVAFAKRPRRDAKLIYCARPRDVGDMRFCRLEPKYELPNVDALAKIDDRIARSNALRSALAAAAETLSLDAKDEITASLAREAATESKLREIILSQLDPTPANGVIDDVAEYEAQMRERADSEGPALHDDDFAENDDADSDEPEN